MSEMASIMRDSAFHRFSIYIYVTNPKSNDSDQFLTRRITVRKRTLDYE